MLKIEQSRLDAHRIYPKGSSSYQNTNWRKVHGVCKLPDGYELAILPPTAVVTANVDDLSKGFHISSSYNFAQITISILQLMASSTTLYETRGDQLSHYGYAAFDLTVLPYIIMSAVNLLGNLFCPNHETIYLVESPELQEAKARGGKFDGAIGKLVELKAFKIEEGNLSTNLAYFVEKESQVHIGVAERATGSGDNTALAASMPKTSPARLVYCAVDACTKLVTLEIPAHVHFEESHLRFSFSKLEDFVFIFAPIPLIVVAILTHFHEGSSTTAQRVWTMMWLVFNSVFGFIAGVTKPENRNERNDTLIWLLAVPAIGGVVVVGQMLREYGVCCTA